MRYYISIFILSLLTMVLPLCVDAYLPATESIEHYFHTTEQGVQLSIAIFTLCSAISMLICGVVSDSLGRKKLISIALILFLISTVIIIFLKDFNHFLVLRGIQGFTSGIVGVLSRSIVQDLYSGVKAHKAMALISMLFAFCPILAPLFGGILDDLWGWQSVFMGIAAFTFLTFLAFMFYMPESLPKDRRNVFKLNSLISQYAYAFKNHEFILRIVTLVLASAFIPILIGSAHYLTINVLHFPSTQLFLLLSPSVLGGISGSICSSKLAATWTNKKFIVVSLIITVGAVLISGLVTSLFPDHMPFLIAVIPWFLYSFAFSFSNPSMTVYTLNLLNKNHQGLASAVLSFSLMIGFSICIGIITPLLSGNVFLIFVIPGCLGIIGYLLWVLNNIIYHYKEVKE